VSVVWKVPAEMGEEFAVGRIGAACPFCGEHTALITRKEDRQGLIEAWWECESCDEMGPCLASGELEWIA
jgi:hypothetical protein